MSNENCENLLKTIKMEKQQDLETLVAIFNCQRLWLGIKKKVSYTTDITRYMYSFKSKVMEGRYVFLALVDEI